jgi:hypothetical protein
MSLEDAATGDVSSLGIQRQLSDALALVSRLQDEHAR